MECGWNQDMGAIKVEAEAVLILVLMECGWNLRYIVCL